MVSVSVSVCLVGRRLSWCQCQCLVGRRLSWYQCQCVVGSRRLSRCQCLVGRRLSCCQCQCVVGRRLSCLMGRSFSVWWVEDCRVSVSVSGG